MADSFSRHDVVSAAPLQKIAGVLAENVIRDHVPELILVNAVDFRSVEPGLEVRRRDLLSLEVPQVELDRTFDQGILKELQEALAVERLGLDERRQFVGQVDGRGPACELSLDGARPGVAVFGVVLQLKPRAGADEVASVLLDHRVEVAVILSLVSDFVPDFLPRVSIRRRVRARRRRRCPVIRILVVAVLRFVAGLDARPRPRPRRGRIGAGEPGV